MSDWPDLTVLVVTYFRPDEIRRTISALLQFLQYSGKLNWLLADDGSPCEYYAGLQRDFPSLDFALSIAPRGGWAVNVNKAMQAVQTDYMFLCEDDYVARQPLDLSRGVALLEAVPAIGLVRYDGVAGHDLDLQLREARTRVGRLAYMVVDKSSPHLNVYSHRPHLKHRRFHDHYGLYREGRPMGQTEEEFAFRVKDDKEGPGVAVLDDGVARAFEHIGKSRQGSDADPCYRAGGMT